MRACATEHGVSIEEYVQRYGLEEADRCTDERTAQFGQKEDNFIYIGRLSWYYIPDAIKVLIICEPGVRVERVTRREYKKHKWTRFQTWQELIKRDNADRLRYRRTKGIYDFTDQRHYDLIVDSSFETPGGAADVAEEILAGINHLLARRQQPVLQVA